MLVTMLLNALENLLASAAQARAPSRVKVTPGPLNRTARSTARCIALSVTEMTGGEAERGRPRARAEVRLPSDGVKRDFLLPDGELLEVEVPPGRFAWRGDDFELDGRTLRFYTAPPAGELRAALGGDFIRGVSLSMPAELFFRVEAWSKDPLEAESMLLGATASVIEALEVAEILSFGTVELGGRFLKPKVSLVKLDRMSEDGGQRSMADLRAKGTLELEIRTSEAQLESIIRAVRLERREVQG